MRGVRDSHPRLFFRKREMRKVVNFNAFTWDICQKMIKSKISDYETGRVKGKSLQYAKYMEE